MIDIAELEQIVTDAARTYQELADDYDDKMTGDPEHRRHMAVTNWAKADAMREVVGWINYLKTREAGDAGSQDKG